ncbi:MAG: hypothetical protein ACLQK8_14885 [Streptosporangiaceae bacterium]|jgi:hypothetical protein
MTMNDQKETRVRDQPGDDELEEELRRTAASLDPVPPELLRAAADAFTWRTVDAELAELVYDSLVDEDALALVRGGSDRRLLSFEAGGLSIDLEVSTAGAARELTGQLAPPQRASIEIRAGSGRVRTDADELGRFRATSVPAGPMSLRCQLAAAGTGPAIVTDWISA